LPNLYCFGFQFRNTNYAPTIRRDKSIKKLSENEFDLVYRNVATDEYKVELDIIRIGFNVKPSKPIKIRRRDLKKAVRLGNGGITETVKLLNSLIMGLICGVISLVFAFEVGFYNKGFRLRDIPADVPGLTERKYYY